MALEIKTRRQEAIIVDNVIRACEDINKLKKTGYNFLYLASGFIAHYNLYGFIDHYTRNSLREDILRNRPNNQWGNFHKGERDYEYMMQKKRMYNAICDAISD